MLSTFLKVFEHELCCFVANIERCIHKSRMVKPRIIVDPQRYVPVVPVLMAVICRLFHCVPLGCQVHYCPELLRIVVD